MNNSTLVAYVEDNDLDYRVAVRSFHEAGFHNEIMRFKTGDQALSYFFDEKNKSKHLPNLILLDLNMPGTTGKDVLAKIKNDTRLKLIPVIILTSSNDTKEINECYQLGANGYIAKPVDFDSMMYSIKKLVDYIFTVNLLPKV